MHTSNLGLNHPNPEIASATVTFLSPTPRYPAAAETVQVTPKWGCRSKQAMWWGGALHANALSLRVPWVGGRNAAWVAQGAHASLPPLLPLSFMPGQTSGGEQGWKQRQCDASTSFEPASHLPFSGGCAIPWPLLDQTKGYLCIPNLR